LADGRATGHSDPEPKKDVKRRPENRPYPAKGGWSLRIRSRNKFCWVGSLPPRWCSRRKVPAAHNRRTPRVRRPAVRRWTQSKGWPISCRDASHTRTL